MTRIALADDLLAEDVNADPYPYLAALREHDRCTTASATARGWSPATTTSPPG